MICGQKSILIILSTSLLQIWFSLGKKGQKKKKKGFKPTVCQWVTSLFPFSTKTGNKSKKASDNYLGKFVIKLGIKYTFFL